MSEDTHIWGCEECSAELAELALGVLTGRERARALAHVDSCPRCADELEQLSRAADTMMQAAPDAEPPMGFEVRLFERMGVSDVSHRRTGHRWSPRWASAAVATAAAAVAALGVGLGLTLTSSPAPVSVAQGHARGALESHNLVHDGRTVGHVVYFDGAKPWMSMMLADPGVQGQVNCVVISKNGVTHWVGTLTAHDGSGAWFATLHVNPDNLRTAQVVSPNGAVLASASLT